MANFQMKLWAIGAFAALLSACSDLAVFIPTQKNLFTIESSANLVTSDTYILEWKPLKNTKSYEVVIASDEDCENVIFRKDQIDTTTLTLDALNDGFYNLCVYAVSGSKRIGAKNNGIALTIDRSSPQVKIPDDILEAKESFQPDIQFEDLTDISVAWSQISGPGAVTFSDPLSSLPSVTATVDGIYKIKAIVKDAAGNTVEQIYQFYWHAVPSNTMEFVSLLASGVAADGFIGASESSSTDASWTLVQSGASDIAYSDLILNPSGSLTCDDTQSYSASKPANAASMAADGSYVICVKLSDKTGKLVYGKSEVVVRDTAPPTLTTFASTNAASDGLITSSEILLINPIWTVTATGESKVFYTPAFDDTAGTVVCDDSQVYSLSSGPTPASLSTDGLYASCVKLVDAAGNTSYGKSSQVIRNTVGPTFTTLALANAAADGYINDSEKALSTPLWTLTQSGSTTIAYTLPLSDSAGTLACSGSQVYNQTTLPGPADLTTDGSWVVCVRLTNVIGNNTFGKASLVIRDTVPPSFSSLANTGAASDGFISDSEKASTAALWTLAASGYSQAQYTVALSDTGGALVCDSAKSYTLSAAATASPLTTDGIYASCVKLVDAAGNVSFGKSAQVERDTSGPAVTAFSAANDASDGFINVTEISSTAALWTLTQTGAVSLSYSSLLDDSAGTLTCSSSQTYNQSTIPRAVDLTIDGHYTICAKLTDTLGNLSYAKAEQVVRGTSGPTFGSLNAANAASDGYINDSEKSATTVLWTLLQSGGTSISYTSLLDNSGTPVICDANQTYGQTTIPIVTDITTDSSWVICVKLVDGSTNTTYGKSTVVVRDIVSPLFTSLLKANAASDGFINDSEKLLVSSLWTLSATGHAIAEYSAAADDTGSALACTSARTYNLSSSPLPSNLSSDGIYAACVRLTDAAGNVTYGKSDQILRDVVFPTLTSLNAANEASDGFISNSEKNSTSALYALVAAGQTSTQYSTLMDDTSNAVTCDSLKTYGSATLPTIASVTPDGTYALCVKLTDSAGNSTYGKSAQVVRDTAAPVISSFVTANAATDGFINDSEKSMTTALWALTGAGASTTHYTVALDDTGTVTCDGVQTYSSTTIPKPNDLASDKPWIICARLADASGNITYGKSPQVVRDTVAPVFTSMIKANAAADGYINDADKSLTSTMWTLSASGQTTTHFTTALSDTSSALTCIASRTYSETAIAVPTSLTADGAYALCVRLVDAAGNTTFGKSEQIQRDVVYPVFTTLARANEASDGIINIADQSSALPLYALTASGQTSANYSSALDDSTPITCDNSKAYGSSTIPVISSVTPDGTYAVCVVLEDAAGNKTYGKSAQVVRDTLAPVFTSLVNANAGSDAYINNAEKSLTTALWTLTASGQTATAYTLPLSNSPTALVCSSSLSFGLSAPAIVTDMTSDGAYASCVRLTDASGNITYGKSGQITRDIAAPTFTSMVGANEASDNYINDSEKASTSALLTLSASGQATTEYTAALDDSTPITCSISQTYGSSTIATIVSITTDGKYAVCVKLTDAAGNITYGKSSQITRDTDAPTLTSLSGINAGSDGYVNDAEKSLTNALWIISQTGASTINYTAALDDTTPVTCNASKTYSASIVPIPTDLTSDKPWIICVKLVDASGNIAYGKSTQIIRDIVGPTFTSLVKANAAVDGYISDSEKLLINEMWTLSASGQTSTDYTVALSDTSSALTCTSSRTFNQTTIADPSSLSADGAFAICVRLTDVAGNITYGKSQQVVRDVTFPIFTSLAKANEAADGYINNSDKTSNLALYTLTASDYLTDDFTAASDDTSNGLVCNSSRTYSNANIPAISSIATDGPYAICVVLADAAGNKTYGKSDQVIRSITVPTITSLALTNSASDGYINNAEKALTTAMWALTGSNYTVAAYTVATSDPSGTLTCTSSNNYNQSSIAIPTSISTDGTYSICARVNDAAGNLAYAKGTALVRDTGLPVLTSLARANQASDGYVNNAEKAFTTELYTLTATGYTVVDYTVALSDTSGALVCDSNRSYTASTIALISSLTSDGAYAVCVRLKDAAQNITYGKSDQVTRDIVAPVVTVNTLSTTDLTPQLTGTVDNATATIAISVNNRNYYATNNGNNTWTLADNTMAMTGTGVYNVVATATDNAQNSSSDSTTNELTITAPAFTSTWKTDNAGSSDSVSIKLPLVASGTYSFVVQWGDGRDDIISAWDSVLATHSYSSPGTYTVTISGTMTGWAFANSGDKLKMLTLTKWGPFKFGNTGGYFEGAANLTITASDSPNLTGTTNFEAMFKGCAAIVSIPNLGSWNTAAVTNMNRVFQDAVLFNQSINGWNVAAVLSMGAMFQNAQLFNQDLNSWNVSAVTDMQYVFYNAWAFNGNITTWVPSSATSMAYMFCRAFAFNQAIGSWNVGNVVNMGWMFDGAKAFNQSLNTWNVTKVTNFEATFASTDVFNGNITSWVPSAGTTMSYMFAAAKVFNQNIGSWNVTNVRYMNDMFQGAVAFNQNLNSWNVSKVQNFQGMFSGATAFNGNITSWTPIAATNMAWMFYRASAFNQAIGSWVLGPVTLFNSMFQEATVFNQPLNSWSTSSATNMEAMFAQALAFNQPLSSWNVSKVTNMSSMFRGTPFNQNINNWTVSLVQNFSNMFAGCWMYNQPLNSWNTAAATTTANMFDYATSFNQPLNNWNMASVTTTFAMFAHATSFNSAIGSWNLISVTNTESMFYGATSFNQPIGSWNVSNVTTAGNMFREATVFNQNINSWNVSKITSFFGMFYYARDFNSPLASWDMSSAKITNAMFYITNSFNQPVGSWNLQAVENSENMFNKSLAFNQDVSGWWLKNATAINGMFSETAMSQTNYSNLLIAWSGKVLKPNLTLNSGTIKYLNTATSARNSLISTKGWTIIDGGLGP
ncbi:MAG: BspA family leucine-rich repeat surface protein [Proteobacteria bacterium]|nr:MAG: BspA family leucine-rich repeat surface protein [Pseudomonadota bacterium]